MKHSRITPQFLIEFSLLFWMNRLVPIFSHGQRRRMATLLGTGLYRLFPYRKQIVMSNLERAFPEKTPRWRKEITRKTYQNFARIYLDILAGYQVSDRRLSRMIDSENASLIDAAIKENKGVIIVLFHFGNWELIADWLARRGYIIAGVAARQFNPLVDRLITDVRTCNGLRIFPKGRRQAVRIYRFLKRDHLLYMVSDQFAGGQGTWVRFLNQWSSSFQGPALFALRQQCPIILAKCLLNEHGRYDLCFERFIPDLPHGLDDTSKIQYLVQCYTRYFEAQIRRHPDQYYWFHRRWKKPIPAEIRKKLEQK